MSAVSCAWTGLATVAHSRATSRGTTVDRRTCRAVLSTLSTVIALRGDVLMLSCEISRGRTVSTGAISEREKTAAGAEREYEHQHHESL